MGTGFFSLSNSDIATEEIASTLICCNLQPDMHVHVHIANKVKTFSINPIINKFAPQACSPNNIKRRFEIYKTTIQLFLTILY